MNSKDGRILVQQLQTRMIQIHWHEVLGQGSCKGLTLLSRRHLWQSKTEALNDGLHGAYGHRICMAVEESGLSPRLAVRASRYWHWLCHQQVDINGEAWSGEARAAWPQSR